MQIPVILHPLPPPLQSGPNRHAGVCGAADQLMVARAALHHWEEPCISGTQGSGTVFFSGCSLKCCYCQNYKISQEGLGKAIDAARLAKIFLELQQKALTTSIWSPPPSGCPGFWTALAQARTQA